MSKAPLLGDYRVALCGHSGCDRQAGTSRRCLTRCLEGGERRSDERFHRLGFSLQPASIRTSAPRAHGSHANRPTTHSCIRSSSAATRSTIMHNVIPYGSPKCRCSIKRQSSWLSRSMLPIAAEPCCGCWVMSHRTHACHDSGVPARFADRDADLGPVSCASPGLSSPVCKSVNGTGI